MKKMTKDEMKKVIGGVEREGNYCGSDKLNGCCNIYCGTGSEVDCKGTCGTCTPAGNGQNPNIPGGDKLCVQFV